MNEAIFCKTLIEKQENKLEYANNTINKLLSIADRSIILKQNTLKYFHTMISKFWHYQCKFNARTTNLFQRHHYAISLSNIHKSCACSIFGIALLSVLRICKCCLSIGKNWVESFNFPSTKIPSLIFTE